MRITDQLVDQAFADLKSKCGGVRNDYFALLYLQHHHDVPREEAIDQVAFGGKDYGIDGFYFDKAKRNLYLFQFKYSESHQQFKESFERLIDTGMQHIFDADKQDQHENQLIQQIKSCITDNTAIIDRVIIHFVFLGDPKTADGSPVLDRLREDLENKKYLVENALGRPVPLVIEFHSARTGIVGGASHVRKRHTYPLHLTDESLLRAAGESLREPFRRRVGRHWRCARKGNRVVQTRADVPGRGRLSRQAHPLS